MNGMCRKETCEFLHVWDESRMSLCPFGENCKTLKCPFRHLDKETICSNYEQGFCSLGRMCPHKHVHRPGPPPDVASFFLETYRKYSKDDKLFRSKPCSYFTTNGWCPYFDMCAFRH